MLAVKPLAAFEALDLHLSLNAPTLKFHPCDAIMLTMEPTVVTVVRQGAFKIERMPENIVVAVSAAPLIFGLATLFIPRKESYQLTALTECEIYQMTGDECRSALDHHHLWREAFQWISWISGVQEKRDVQLIGKSSYSQIRATLQAMSAWDDSLRARIGVMNYIQQRTHISRSVIAEVLAALRAGKYIEMNKGKLVSVNRLPLEY